MSAINTNIELKEKSGGIMSTKSIYMLYSGQWEKHPAYIDRSKALLFLDGSKIDKSVIPARYRWILLSICEYSYGNWESYDSRNTATKRFKQLTKY